MYQTVGQDAIELVAKALDVPLYRRVISGSAKHQGAEYGSRTAHGSADLMGDETEDLYHLLSTVLVRFSSIFFIIASSENVAQEHHPEIQGVSVGAILSNYQRVRVEHV
jgi:diphthine-ammonia ligase